VLDTAEARELLDSIDVSSHAGLRDRALIGLMVYSFAHIGAALGMTVKDVSRGTRGKLGRVRDTRDYRSTAPSALLKLQFPQRP
jgi:hypothetical protein